MANRTIAGMPFCEFFKELAKDVPVKEKKDGSTYIPVDSVESRVGELLLPSNYNFSCSNPQVVEVGKRKSVSVLGRLELLDDTGKIVCVRELPGGAEIQFLQDEADRPANDLKSYVAAAKSNSFVNAWLAMGLANKVDLSFKKGGSTQKGKKYEITLTSNLSYSNKGKPMICGEAVVGGEKVSLRIFQEGLEYFSKNNRTGKVLSIEEVVKCLTENFGSSKAKKTLVGFGYFSEYNGKKQFVFQKGGE